MENRLGESQMPDHVIQSMVERIAKQFYPAAPAGAVLDYLIEDSGRRGVKVRRNGGGVLWP